MYAPHKAREDTVLFPALHTIISPHEYDSLSEQFEKLERQTFGGDGFDIYVKLGNREGEASCSGISRAVRG